MNWLDYWADPKFDDSFWKIRMEYFYDKLKKVVKFDQSMEVLDYGAGPGLLGPIIRSNVKHICLAEKSRLLFLRSKSINNFDNASSVWIDSDATTEKYLNENKFDLILMNSVLQYIPKNKTEQLFHHFKKGLKSGGKIIVSDIVPKRLSFWRDVLSVVAFYLRRGHLLGLIRFILLELSKIKQRNNLSLFSYTKEEFENKWKKTFHIQWIQNPTISHQRLAAIMTVKS